MQLKCFISITISFTSTCFGPYGPSSGGAYISHFSMVLSVLQRICCFCDFVIVYACSVNYSMLIYSFSYSVKITT
jgi:hypothetical protein